MKHTSEQLRILACLRIVEYPELEGAHKDHWIQLLAPHRTPKNQSICLRVIQMLLELCQAQCHDCFLREPVSVANHPLGEKPFPDVQPEPPMVQFHSIPLGPVTGCQREKISACPPILLLMKLQAAMRLPLSLFSRLNKPSDFSCSSYMYIFPSIPFTIFAVLAWILSDSFMSFLNCGAQNCT